MNFSLDSTAPVLTKPTHCHWCGGTLERIRDIRKGIACERYYDSKDCHQKGEDRALRYRAALAGTVS